MDLAKLLKVEGEWLTVELATTSPVGELKFKVLQMSIGEAVGLKQMAEQQPEKAISFCEMLVVDWNLELNGVALACDEENKRKYLSLLFDWKTAGGENLLVSILGFAQDKKNYAKN